MRLALHRCWTHDETIGQIMSHVQTYAHATIMGSLDLRKCSHSYCHTSRTFTDVTRTDASQLARLARDTGCLPRRGTSIDWVRTHAPQKPCHPPPPPQGWAMSYQSVNVSQSEGQQPAYAGGSCAHWVQQPMPCVACQRWQEDHPTSGTTSHLWPSIQRHAGRVSVSAFKPPNSVPIRLDRLTPLDHKRLDKSRKNTVSKSATALRACVRVRVRPGRHIFEGT